MNSYTICDIAYDIVYDFGSIFRLAINLLSTLCNDKTRVRISGSPVSAGRRERGSDSIRARTVSFGVAIVYNPASNAAAARSAQKKRRIHVNSGGSERTKP